MLKLLKFITTRRFSYLDTVWMGQVSIFIHQNEWIPALVVLALGALISIAAEHIADSAP